MKQTWLIVLMLIFACLHSQALPTDQFVLGAYTQHDLWRTLSNTSSVFTELGSRLSSAGFNAAGMSINPDHSLGLLRDATDAFSSFGEKNNTFRLYLGY